MSMFFVMVLLQVVMMVLYDSFGALMYNLGGSVGVSEFSIRVAINSVPV